MSLFAILGRLGETLAGEFAAMTPLEIALACLAALTALYSLSQLWLLLGRQSRGERLVAVRRAAAEARLPGAPLDNAGMAARPWYDRMGAFVATTAFVGPADRVRLARVLADAGFRGGKYRVATLIAVKVGLGLAAALGGWLAFAFYGWIAQFGLFSFPLLLGLALAAWRVPDIVLGRLAAGRRERIDAGLPDALDLMVISAEAGLSFEQGIDFVAREMGPSAADVSEEFRLTAAELRVLGDRSQALRNLAERVDLRAARSIVTTLMQTLRYGTPLAQSLRVLAAEMRNARLLQIEARAARMPVLMTMPLMGFILPTVIIICAGPAILKAIDAFGVLAK